MKKLKILLLAAVVLAVAATTRAQDIVDAVTRGDLARVKELVEKNPELAKARTPRSATVLHVAARLDNEAVAAYLIEKGADVNAVQDDSRTPLLGAGIKVTRVLVEHGANLEYTTRDGFSALSLALHTGDEEVFDYLLGRGAKLVLPPPGTYRRLVAIEEAMRMAKPRVFETLCEQGLDKSFENAARMTLAHFAAERGSAELIQKLVAYGAPMDRADIFGRTPLHIAAYEGNQAAVEALLGRGLNKNARTVDGKTPYLLARESKKTAVADYLAARGADTSGPTPPALSGPYFGQKPPGRTPVPFVPGIPGIRDDRHGIFSFTPDGKDVYWKPRWSPFTALSHAQLKDGRWTCAIPPFSAENQGDDAPFVSPDGSRLFFLSQRPVVDGKLTFPYVEKIWMMTRTAGGWSEPQKLPDEVNKVAGAHWQLSADAQNNLYFGARGGVHYARFAAGQYLAAERLGPPINDGKTASFSPFIARDGSYLLFSRPHPVYTYQLFISFRRPDGTWNEAVNLSETLDHPYSLNGRVSPDGKYLFFSGRSGVDYWVDASVIETLRPQPPQTSAAAAQGGATSVAVPQGTGVPVITDGIFTPGEWDDAQSVAVADGVTLHIKEYRGVVFIGVRGQGTNAIGPSELSLAVPNGPIQKLHRSFALFEVVVPREGPEPEPRMGFTADWYANEMRRDETESARLQKEGKNPIEVMQATTYPSDGIEFAIRRSKLPGQVWLMRLWASAFVGGRPEMVTYPPAAAERSTDAWLEVRFK